MIIQSTFEIPDHILEGIISDKYIRYGGVVRDNFGHIVTHLKEVPTPMQNQPSNMLHVAEVLKTHKIGILIGLGAVIAAGGLVLFVAEKNKKNIQNTTPEILKCVEDYNTSLCAYLEAVRNGSLDIDTINCLIANLDSIKENNDSGKINIDFSTEQLDTLVNIIFEYTRNLAEANFIELNELKEPAYVSVDNTIIDLRRYLEIQKNIFEEAI